jgi:hypothetical protein
VSRDARNRSGGAYGLAVYAPLAAEDVTKVSQYLDELGTGDASPLARVPGTHFARWVIMDELVYGGGSQKRDTLKAPRLLFSTNFDGDLDAYLEAMRTGLGEDADAIWGACPGYPGRGDSEAWARWFKSHQVDCSLFVAAYGEQTVDEVKANVDLRTRLQAFALEAQGLAPEHLQARFREAFAT